MSTRIYSYGLLPPSTGWDARYEEHFRCEGQPEPGVRRFFEQIELGHAYRNTLANLENAFRERAAVESASHVAPALLEHKSHMDALSDRIEVVREAIRQKRQAKKKSAAVDVTAERDTIKKLVEDRKAAKVAFREEQAKQEGLPTDLKQRFRTANAELRAATKEAAVASSPTSAARLVAARDVIEQLRAERKAARRVIPRLVALDAIQREKQEAINQARAASKVYVGTYQVIEQSAKAAASRPEKRAASRFVGEGRVGVYLNIPQSVDSIVGGGCRHVQIDPPMDAAWDENTPCAMAKRLRRTKARIRVGSEDRDPIWVEFQCVYHRPLPADGVVRWAWVKRMKEGPRFEYRLYITVDADSFDQDARFTRKRLAAEGARGTIAVDVGWRRTPRGLRVAYWVDDRGDHGEVLLDPEVERRLDLADDIASRRDRNFNVARAYLAAWIANQENVPEWLMQTTKSLALWKSPRALNALVERWAGGRFRDLVRAANPHRPERWPVLQAFQAGAESKITFPGDAAILGGLLTWASQDFHLAMEGRVEQRALARRKDQYRNLGVTWAKTYARIVFETFDLRNTAVAAPPEEASYESGRRIRSAQRTAAPSELRESCEWAFMKRGGSTARVIAVDSTVRHAACGQIMKGDPATDLYLYCEKCMVTVDQDRNAGDNLLMRDHGPPDVENVPVEKNGAASAVGEGT